MRRWRASSRCAIMGGMVERRSTGVETSSPNLEQSLHTERTVLSIATVLRRGTSAPHNSHITKSSPQRLNKKCWVYRLRPAAHPLDDCMDEEQIREFSEEMSERIASLEYRKDKLLDTARRVEGGKRDVGK